MQRERERERVKKKQFVKFLCPNLRLFRICISTLNFFFRTSLSHSNGCYGICQNDVSLQSVYDSSCVSGCQMAGEIWLANAVKKPLFQNSPEPTLYAKDQVSISLLFDTKVCDNDVINGTLNWQVTTAESDSQWREVEATSVTLDSSPLGSVCKIGGLTPYTTYYFRPECRFSQIFKPIELKKSLAIRTNPGGIPNRPMISRIYQVRHHLLCNSFYPRVER